MLLKFLRIFQLINFVFSYLKSSFNEKLFLRSHFKGKYIENYFDVGANNGFNISLYSRYLVIKNIHAFEPSRSAFNFLKTKFRKNKFIKINNFALSDSIDEKIFYDYKVNSQSTFHKLEDNQIFSKLNQKYLVRTDYLDSYCLKNHINKIDFIKIDAQSEDYNILLGMHNLLSNKKINLIKIEISIDKNKNIENDEVFKIIKLMHEYQYRLVSISEIK